jgi:hypothetical protein
MIRRPPRSTHKHYDVVGCDVWACKYLPTCVQVTLSYQEGGSEKQHRNDGQLPRNCTAPHPTVQSSARGPQISRHHYYISAMFNLRWNYFKIRWIASLSDYVKVKVKVSLYTLWIESGTVQAQPGALGCSGLYSRPRQQSPRGGKMGHKINIFSGNNLILFYAKHILNYPHKWKKTQ